MSFKVACVASVSVGSKMGRVKEGGGEERKETLADKPLDFENHPHAQRFHSVIGCHELTNKILCLLQQK